VEDEGRIAAVAPFFLQTRNAGPITAWRYVLFLADRLAQYTDIITAREDTVPIWDALRNYLAEQFPGSWLRAHDVLPDATLAISEMLPDECEVGETYLRIPLRGLDENVLVSRADPHMQRELQRTRRRMEESGDLRWEAVAAPGEQLVDVLITLNRARFGEASWFADETHRVFFHRACAAAGSEAVFSVLRHEDLVVHIMSSWLHGDSMLYVLSGMDEQFKRLSPGTMNLDHSIRYAMSRGCSYFDFLRGDEAYKREFAPEERRSEHWSLTGPGPSLRYRLARQAQRVARGRSA
jgi:CelD/BcsL family acetyltransferase involved in cellulose biosynthesis